MTQQRYGYIGLGNIGKPMCASLIRNSKAQVQVYDVMPEPVAEMMELGGVAAENPASLAANCEFIALCVRHDQDVEELFYQQGLLDAAAPGTVIAIHSTVTKANVLKWAEDLKARGLFLLDAGITGGAHGAEAAELCIMVGGDEGAAKRAKPMFEATSKLIVYCGESGAGIVTKLCLNLMNFQSFVAATEGTELMKAAGLDPQRLFDVSKGNGVLHPLMEMFILGREGVAAGCSKEDAAAIFAPPCGLAEKDLGHALDLAAELDVDVSSTAAARRNVRRAFLQPEQ